MSPWVWGVLALCLGGCGGEVERAPSKPSSKVGAPSSEPLDGGAALDPQETLGDCEGGFDPSEEPDRDCNWVAEDICYEDKLAACACACPMGTAVSTCTSGFPYPDGEVDVYCF